VKNSGRDLDRLFPGREFRISPPRAVIGLEAEFNLLIDGRRRRPEKVGDSVPIVHRRMIPRTGKSFQLPAGGAFTSIPEDQAPPDRRWARLLSAHAPLWEQIRYFERAGSLKRARLQWLPQALART
jgi:hypothetical protein